MQEQNTVLESESGADLLCLQTLRMQCQEAVEYWIERANSMPEARGRQITVPELVFDLRGLSAGIAVISRLRRGKSKIRLNQDLLRRYPQEMLEHTVPHEVAHVVAFRLFGTVGHGVHWQAVMAYFDKPATRCHQMQVEPVRRHKKHRYECACREHWVGPQINARINKGQAYTCRQCKTALRQAA